MKLSDQPVLVALIHELNDHLKQEHGFEIDAPHESIKTNEGEVFEFALMAARNEKGEWPLVPFRSRAFETFDEAEARAFATLVEMSKDSLIRFIEENTPEEVPA